MRTLTLVLLLLCGSAIPARALDPSKAITQYVHDVWQARQGLSQNAVRAIAQTPEGYLWLATQAGLVRFDGVTFTLMSPATEPALQASIILALEVDRRGRLWVGTDGGGLVKLEDGRFSAYMKADGLSQEFIWSVAAGRDGTIWAGAGGGGVNRLLGARVEHVGLLGERVTTMLEDRTGALWIGTTGGLRRLAGDDWQVYTTAEGLPSEAILSLCEDRHGTLWIGTNRGLTRFEDGRFTTYTTRDGLPSDSVHALLDDRHGNLWVGTLDGGLARLGGDRFEVFSRQDGLTDSSVLALFEDREGSLWIGTRNGLNRLRDGAITTVTAREGLPTDWVRAVLAGADGAIWVATDGGGLARLDEGRVTVYTRRDGLPDERVTWMHEARDGSLWVAAGENGLSRVADGRIASWPTPTRLAAIAEDADGLLASTPDGRIFRFDEGRFVEDAAIAAHVRDVAYMIYVDRRGGRWFGTNDGLFHEADGRWRHYTTRDGLASNHAYAIYEDRDGIVWIATRGGLSRVADGALVSYTRAEGLPDEIIFHVLEDDVGYFWINASLGIFRVARRELEAVAAGRQTRVTAVMYGTADGMKSAEASAHVQPAAARAPDGRLWFVSAKGVASVDPRNIPRNELVPTVLIEHVQVDGERAAPAARLELAAETRRVEFHYTALSLLAPEKVRFQYRLEGYDADWVDAGGARSAAYATLPPGRYTFRVKASNNDGVWNEQGAAQAFTLAPRFYQTAWFYLACGLSAGLMTWGVYRLRLRGVRAEFALVLAERNRLAREFHDTLEAGFVGITLQLDVASAKLRSAPGLALQHLALARNMVMHSMAEARRSVWDLRAHALQHGDLGSALARVARDVSGDEAVRASVQVLGTARRLPAVTETNILRIGQEAITNAVKHARPSRLAVELSFEAARVRLRVEDDGCGFEPPDTTSTNGTFGLLGMRERANKLGGTLTVRSTPGRGTEVTVEVPLPS